MSEFIAGLLVGAVLMLLLACHNLENGARYVAKCENIDEYVSFTAACVQRKKSADACTKAAYDAGLAWRTW